MLCLSKSLCLKRRSRKNLAQAARLFGVRAVHEVIRQNRRIAAARLALHRVRDLVHPVSLEELTRITEIWVETALQLGEKSLRIMERLVRAQLRRVETAPENAANTFRPQAF